MANYEVLTESVQDYLYEESLSVMEGVNSDMTKKLRDLQEQFKDITKEAKDLYKGKNYKEAITKCDEMLSIIDKISGEIDSVGDTAGSVVAGYFYQSFASSIKASLLGLITFGIGSIVSGIKDTVDIISGLIEQWKKDGELTLKMANMRRAKINGLIKNMKTIVENLKKQIENEMKDSEKKDEPVKESASEVRLEIYESCRSGEITEEERDLLLGML